MAEDANREEIPQEIVTFGTIQPMDSDKRLALAVLLTVGGVIWLFFCVIWMPPLATALVYMTIWLRVPADEFPFAVLRYEFILPLCCLIYGAYIAVKRYIDSRKAKNQIVP